MDERTYFDAAPGGARVASTTDIADDDWGPLSDLPGNPMIWLLILSELAVFGALFGGFAAVRLLKPDIYVPSQAVLDPVAAGIASN